MIAVVGACLMVAAFAFLVQWFGLVEKSRIAVSLANRSLGVIRSSKLSDDAKEASLRKDALQLFRLFFALAFGGTAAILSPMGALWLCDRLGLIAMASVSNVITSYSFIIVSSVMVVLAMAIGSRRTWTKPDYYSVLERSLHRLAFRTRTAQVAIADIEDRAFAGPLASCKSERPVFITALPRAGTTLLLECCAGMREFASHCYRDMPFVLAPCLWNRFSKSFRKTAEPQPRAHGDGMLITFDSPEALEEVVWKTFWRRHYGADRIIPWQAEEDDEDFSEFFRSHMRKIILLRRGTDAAAARYVSKNNLNIARIPMLRRLFPDSVILVPFREPRHHACSLFEQHRNFLRIHQADAFASEYMRAIGHYDFGENLRPVDFDGWFERRESRNACSLAFWLEYWMVGYRHLLAEDGGFIHLVDYDALCDDPQRGMKLVADMIGDCDVDALQTAASRVHGVRPRDVNVQEVPVSLLQEVDRVYAGLREAARA